MKCTILRSLVSLAALTAACSNPPTRPSVLDAGIDTGIDTGSDLGMDAPVLPDVPTAMDVPASDAAPDVPADVPLGAPFCDLPATGDAVVTGAVLPPGFCIRRFGRLQHPRVMAFSPTGDLFVASPQQEGAGGTGPGIGAIAVLPDDNHDGVADSTPTGAPLRYLDLSTRRELETVHGLLFHNGSLYYTASNGVYQLPYTPGDRHVATGVVPTQIADLTDAERWTHTLAVRGDTLYVSMGVYGASRCPLPNVRQGAILAVGPGHGPMGDVVARGFRNPMYLRCQPWGECYAAELTDDGWGGPGHEKIVSFSAGQDYGYPCCYDRGLPSMVDGASTYNCGAVQSGIDGFPVSYTPFGHDYEKGTWPAPYNGGLFVGLHGQVGSWAHTGITWAPTDPATHHPNAAQSVFLGGWGAPGSPNVGRVADLVFAPDGRMFFTDDQAGTIYWIAPTTLRAPAH